MATQRNPAQPSTRKRKSANKRKIGPGALAQAMVLLAEPLTLEAVAAELKVNRGTVQVWRDSPAGQEKLAIARKARETALLDTVERARKVGEQAAMSAMQALVDATTHGPTKDRIRAAATILDRIGIPRTERVEASVTASFDLERLSVEELKALDSLHKKARGGSQ